jgi:DNA-binding MarR family transcriptional regulator
VSRKKPDAIPAAPGRFAYDGLDRVLHEKARLGILVSLSTRLDGLLFGELKELCALTDGNLSRHLDVLAEPGLIEIYKGFDGRRPQTRIRITESGRERFRSYLAELERVVRDAHDVEVGAEPRPGLAST